MGFFSDVWDGVESVFSEIGDGIKGIFKGVGKAVDELGVVGQIGLAFVLPGIGGMLGGLMSQGLGAVGSAVSGMASQGGLVGAVGQTLQTAGKFASTAGNAFKTVTDGVSSFIDKMGKGMVNSVSEKLGGEALVSGPESVSEGFSSWMQGMEENVKGITSPFSEAAKETADAVSKDWSQSMENPVEEAASNIQAPQAPQAAPTERQAPSVGDTDLPEPDVGGELPTADVPEPASPGASTPGLEEPELVQQFKQENFKFNDVGAETIKNIESKERGFLQRTVDQTVQNTQQALSEAPGRAIETAADRAASDVTTRGLQEAGVGPEQQDVEYTQVSTNIPSFDFQPVEMAYEQAGVNYGGLPDNRLQFYASQEQPAGDFGRSSFQSFQQFRPQA